MPQNPLVGINPHPMLRSFRDYMSAVESFNAHANDIMAMVDSLSLAEAVAPFEFADALNAYQQAVISGDLLQIVTGKGDIYALALRYGMSQEDLGILMHKLTIHAGLTFALSRIEKTSIATLN